VTADYYRLCEIISPQGGWITWPDTYSTPEQARKGYSRYESVYKQSPNCVIQGYSAKGWTPERVGDPIAI